MIHFTWFFFTWKQTHEIDAAITKDNCETILHFEEVNKIVGVFKE